jgi:Phage tail tube protein
MSGSLTTFGIGTESTYGTAVNVTKFFEITKEDVKGNYSRQQAAALSAAYVDRSDRYAVAHKGASGNVDIEVLSKGFGNWLRFLLGTTNTTGPAETSAYTHTGTIGSLFGDNFTCQIGRATLDGTVKPWTYEGGKVTDFSFQNQVDQTLSCSIGMDFETESNPDTPTGAYVLATNIPVTGAEVLAWQGGTISIAGATVDISEFSVKCDNALNVDRFYINSAASKKEPNQDGKRAITWSVKTPYVDNGFWKKVASATNAGATAIISAQWTGLTLLGTTIYPSLKIDIPVARFDEGGPAVDGPGAIEQTFTGVGLYDGTNSALTVTYVSADTTIL